MKRSIDIGSGIAGEFISSDLEAGAGCIVRMLRRIPVREKDVELGLRQTGIGGHSRLQGMREVKDGHVVDCNSELLADH